MNAPRAVVSVALLLGGCQAATEGLAGLEPDGGLAPRADRALDAAGPVDPSVVDPTCPHPADGAPVVVRGSTPLLLDLAPSADRLLVGDGRRLGLFELPSGRALDEVPGERGWLSRSGRTIIAVEGTTVSLHDSAGGTTIVGEGVTCFHQLSPDRRHLIVLTQCAPAAALPDVTIGVLWMVDAEDGQMRHFASEVVLGTIVHSARGVDPPGIAYARIPQPLISTCPVWEAKSVELHYGEVTQVFESLPSLGVQYVFAPGSGRLLRRDATCPPPGEEPERWMVARSGRTIIRGPLTDVLASGPIDLRSASPMSIPPVELGSEGMLAVARTPWRLRYGSYTFGDGRGVELSDTTTYVLGAVLREGPRDVAVVGWDSAGAIRRVALPVGSAPDVVLLDRPLIGLGGLEVSDDHRQVATVAVLAGSDSAVHAGSATGRLEELDRSSEPLLLVGFLPGQRGLVWRHGDQVMRQVSGRVAPLDRGSDWRGPITSDERGCWIAHAGEAGGSMVRVAPVGPP